MQPGVIAVLREQFAVGALLDDLSVVHDQDTVGILDGGETMGDHQGRAVRHQLLQGGLDMALGLGVECGGRLVQDQDRGVLEHGTGNRETLALPAREHHTAVSDPRVEALGHGLDEVERVGVHGDALERLAARRYGLAIGDVVGDAVVEEHHVLTDQRDLGAQTRQAQLVDRDAVDQDLARGRIVEARQ